MMPRKTWRTVFTRVTFGTRSSPTGTVSCRSAPLTWRRLPVLSTLSLPARRILRTTLRRPASLPRSGGRQDQVWRSSLPAASVTCRICADLQGRRAVSSSRDGCAPHLVPEIHLHWLRPTLVGEEFLAKWKGKTILQLAENLGARRKAFQRLAWMKRRISRSSRTSFS